MNDKQVVLYFPGGGTFVVIHNEHRSSDFDFSGDLCDAFKFKSLDDAKLWVKTFWKKSDDPNVSDDIEYHSLIIKTKLIEKDHGY